MNLSELLAQVEKVERTTIDEPKDLRPVTVRISRTVKDSRDPTGYRTEVVTGTIDWVMNGKSSVELSCTWRER